MAALATVRVLNERFAIQLHNGLVYQVQIDLQNV